jgi:hypothetical protein
MEFTYEKENSRGKTMRRTIEVTPTFDDYVEFIIGEALPHSFGTWNEDSSNKVRAILKWLFDKGHLVDESFDNDDDFRDYLYDSYRDSVEWDYELDDEDREW